MQRPWLVHANGRHERLRQSALAPLMQMLEEGAPPPLPAARLADHRVLLVDSYADGPCRLTTLGSLVASNVSWRPVA